MVVVVCVCVWGVGFQGGPGSPQQAMRTKYPTYNPTCWGPPPLGRPHRPWPVARGPWPAAARSAPVLAHQGPGRPLSPPSALNGPLVRFPARSAFSFIRPQWVSVPVPSSKGVFVCFPPKMGRGPVPSSKCVCGFIWPGMGLGSVPSLKCVFGFIWPEVDLGSVPSSKWAPAERLRLQFGFGVLHEARRRAHQ
jgi:hypothetical protein